MDTGFSLAGEMLKITEKTRKKRILNPRWHICENRSKISIYVFSYYFSVTSVDYNKDRTRFFLCIQRREDR